MGLVKSRKKKKKKKKKGTVGRGDEQLSITATIRKRLRLESSQKVAREREGEYVRRKIRGAMGPSYKSARQCDAG